MSISPGWPLTPISLYFAEPFGSELHPDASVLGLHALDLRGAGGALRLQLALGIRIRVGRLGRELNFLLGKRRIESCAWRGVVKGRMGK